MGCRNIGGARLPRHRTRLAGLRAARHFYTPVGLNARRTGMPGARPFRGDCITGLRFGSFIDLIPRNGIDALLTLLLVSVFRESRPTNLSRPTRYSKL